MNNTPPVLPYVYKLTHKHTGHFYFGFRCANKQPSLDDLGILYFTSSKTIKNNFDDYNYCIIAEFFNKDDAYMFEQQLIKNNFDNPLIINKHWQETTTYSMLGFKRPDLSEQNRLTKRKPKEVRHYKCYTCGTNVERLEFLHHQSKEKYYCGPKCRNVESAKHAKHLIRTNQSTNKNNEVRHYTCYTCGSDIEKIERVQTIPKKRYYCNTDCSSVGSKLSLSITRKLKGLGVSSAKNLPRLIGDLNPMRNPQIVAAYSAQVTGRKRKYNDDGSWSWTYPEGLG